LEVPRPDDAEREPEDEDRETGVAPGERADPGDRQRGVAERNQETTHDHGTVGADEPVGHPTADDREQVGEARVPAVEQARVGVAPAPTGIGAGCRLHEVEDEQPAHPVVGEALPHLDQKEEEQARGVTEQHHQERPQCHRPGGETTVEPEQGLSRPGLPAMTRTRGRVMTVGFTLFDTAIGTCGIAWGERGVVGLQLPEARVPATGARLRKRFPDAAEGPPPAPLRGAIDAITRHLDGETRDLTDVPLDMREVPAFHRRVYEAARAITPGATASYGEIATRIGAPGAA